MWCETRRGTENYSQGQHKLLYSTEVYPIIPINPEATVTAHKSNHLSFESKNVPRSPGVTPGSIVTWIGGEQCTPPEECYPNSIDVNINSQGNRESKIPLFRYIHKYNTILHINDPEMSTSMPPAVSIWTKIVWFYPDLREMCCFGEIFQDIGEVQLFTLLS